MSTRANIVVDDGVSQTILHLSARERANFAAFLETSRKDPAGSIARHDGRVLDGSPGMFVASMSPQLLAIVRLEGATVFVEDLVSREFLARHFAQPA